MQPKSKKKPQKSDSKPVQEIARYLDSRKIEYKQEFTFKGCRDKKVLPFDFMIIINGRICLIEYDGEQHFSVVSRYHGTGASARTKFEKGVRHDKTKTTYAYEHSISLLRISYREQEQLQTWIDRFIASMTKGPCYVYSNSKLYEDHIRITNSSFCCVQ